MSMLPTRIVNNPDEYRQQMRASLHDQGSIG